MSSKLEIRSTGISMTDILGLISRGFTYERILFTLKGLTYGDIFRTAKIAKEFVEFHLVPKFPIPEKSRQENPSLEKIRQQYPRAYEKWVEEEDTYLKSKYSEGLNIQELAGILQRKPGAIRSRLLRLGLIEEATPDAKRQSS